MSLEDVRVIIISENSGDINKALSYNCTLHIAHLGAEADARRQSTQGKVLLLF